MFGFKKKENNDALSRALEKRMKGKALKRKFLGYTKKKTPKAVDLNRDLQEYMWKHRLDSLDRRRLSAKGE